MGSALALTGCAALAAGALVVRSDRARAWLMLGALLLAPAILLAHVADSEQVETLRDRPSLAVAAAVLGIALVAALAIVFRRAPGALAIAAVAAIPFRIPISVGGEAANLLLPLYLVVAAGALAWALLRLGGQHAPGAEEPPPAPWLERLLAISLVAYAAQSAYSSDDARALENVVFFYVPFALLYVLLVRLRWTQRLAGAALGVLAGLAAALAAIGYVEYATRHLLLNPKVIASNQLEDYFRVNSLFFDPNIYGRFLAIAIVLITGWMLWRSRTRDVALAGLLVAFLFGGLVLTLSQSSFAALLAGLAVLGGLRWSVRWAVAASGAALVAGLVIVALGTSVLEGSDGAGRATSGRSDLIGGGVRLFADRPLQGWGSGSFAREYRRAEDVSAERASSASHTIPVTVAAEQGLAGLAIYLALLALALARLFGAVRGSGAERVAVAAAFTALAVHTMMYAAFLEDPLTWALLAAGTALAAPAPAAAGAEAEARLAEAA